jgi:hypothetical protein
MFSGIKAPCMPTPSSEDEDSFWDDHKAAGAKDIDDKEYQDILSLISKHDGVKVSEVDAPAEDSGPKEPPVVEEGTERERPALSDMGADPEGEEGESTAAEEKVGTAPPDGAGAEENTDDAKEVVLRAEEEEREVDDRLGP